MNDHRGSWALIWFFSCIATACSNSSDTPAGSPSGAGSGAGQGTQTQPQTAAGSGGSAAGTGSTNVGVARSSAQAGSSAKAGAGGAGAAGGGAGGSEPVAAGSGAGGGGTAGSAAAGAGGNSGASDQAPFMPTGEVITAPDKTWTWVPFPDSTCRDGSNAGIGVSLNSASKKLMIFLEGGGACFDSQTCGSNPANVASQFPSADGTGLFSRSNAANPVADWNIAYVPYCTGDVHMGDASDVMVPGVNGVQQFKGRANLQAFLNRLVPTFTDAEQVLLTGSSAGGFGASSNGEFVQWAFGSVPVTMIDDSGPTMSNKYLPSCLTNTYRTLWGLDNTILKECGSDCSADGDYSVEYAQHVAKVSNGKMVGLIESNDDAVITAFYGIGTDNGANDCKGTLFLTPMDGATFEAGLLDFRSSMSSIYPNYGMYFPASTKHTWLEDDMMYTLTTGSDNVKLVDWITAIVNGTGATQVGM
jgi:hypothetical protein